MVTTPKVRHVPNPRFHADGIPVYFGSSQDARIIYDAANDEWTLQTKNAGGTHTDRIRVKGNQNALSLELAGNNAFLVQTNAAATGTVNLIKANSSDQVELGNYAKVLRDLIDQDGWQSLPINAGWTTVVTGSGAVTQAPRKQQVATGATASSTALARITNQAGWSAGKGYEVINWSKRIHIKLFLCVPSGTTNGIARVMMGKNDTGVDAFTKKGIGIQVENLAFKGIVHDGTSGATIDLSTTLTAGTLYRVLITSDGAGNVEWSLDGVSKGTSAAGPTGDGTAQMNHVHHEVDNGGDAAAQTSYISDIKIYVEQ